MSDLRPAILFVGESPPAGAPPDFRPFDCASGSRLAKVLGLVDRESLLANVPFTNVFPTPTGVKDCPAWGLDDAKERAKAIIHGAPGLTVVCLGTHRVAVAFGVGNQRQSTWSRRGDVDVLVVPHPSGQSQALNTDEQRQEVRRAVLPDLCAATNTTLRPWHFRIDEPAVLADLGLALCPLDPALGAAAAVICAEVFRAKVGPAKVDIADYRAHGNVEMHVIGDLCRGDQARVVLGLRPPGIPERSFIAEVRSRHKFAARTLPRPPSAEVRAAYARLVALGVAP